MASLLGRGFGSVADKAWSKAPGNVLHSVCMSLSRYLPNTGWARGLSTRKLEIDPAPHQPAPVEAVKVVATQWQTDATGVPRSTEGCKSRRLKPPASAALPRAAPKPATTGIAVKPARRPKTGGPPDADPSRALARIVRRATLGLAKHFDYKKTFFTAFPHLVGKVVVHHAVEQRILKLYPGVISKAELHSLQNLRGIPKEINGDLHLSWIRRELNRFYKANPKATKDQILDWTTEIDRKYGHLFTPKVGE